MNCNKCIHLNACRQAFMSTNSYLATIVCDHYKAEEVEKKKKPDTTFNSITPSEMEACIARSVFAEEIKKVSIKVIKDAPKFLQIELEYPK